MQIKGNVTFVVNPQLQLVDQVESAGVAASGSVVKGGIPPYTVSVDDPSTLPPGVTVNSDGSVVGTPTTSGTFVVPVSASDSE